MKNKMTMPWLRFIEGANEAPVENADPKDDPKSEDGSAKEPDWKSEAEKWKNFSRTWEARAKENEDAAKRVKEIEDSNKSELEKMQERMEKIIREASEANEKAEAERKARVRADIANEFGVSVEDRDLYLTAQDEDTLRKQAEGLTKRRGSENPLQGKGGSGNDKATAVAWANSLLGKTDK